MEFILGHCKSFALCFHFLIGDRAGGVMVADVSGIVLLWFLVVYLCSDRSYLFTFVSCLFVDPGSQVTQASLKHPIQLSMTLNF